MISTAVDAILVLVIVEGIGLAWLHRRTGRGPGPVAMAVNLGAGFLLMFALRLALGNGPETPSRDAEIAVVLAGALFAHLVDLAARWRR